MGGKSSSSSSSTQETINETTQASVDGVAAGHILQGQYVNFTENFSPEVREAFGQLIELTGKSLDLVEGAGSFAIQSVADRSEQATQPELSVVRDLVPVLTIAAVGVVAFLILRG